MCGYCNTRWRLRRSATIFQRVIGNTRYCEFIGIWCNPFPVLPFTDNTSVKDSNPIKEHAILCFPF
jgi:hypothetical protein